MVTLLPFFQFMANLQTFGSQNLPSWKQNSKISNTATILLLWLMVLSLLKNAKFLQKNADISKIKEVLQLKGNFLKVHMCVYLRTKFQVSSVILTGFIQGRRKRGRGNFTHSTPKQTSKASALFRINMLKFAYRFFKISGNS